MSTAATLSSTQYKYIFGTAVFDSSIFELKINNKIIKIERRPLDVLETLLRHVDEVMTKDELLDLVWPDIHTVENVVANAITKLRKGLGPDLSNRIITHPRIGYRFIGPIERLAIGRKLVSSMKLKAGKAIQGRPNFKLSEQISAAPSREVWRALHAKTKNSRIFKFAGNGEGLASLKREVTLFRILNQSTERALPVAKILDWNFESEPFFIECEDSGVDLKSWSNTKGQLHALSDESRIILCRDIADAVSQIHDVGILHRDLKPANILISKAESADRKLSVRLIDFGSGSVRDSKDLRDLGVTPMGFTREMEEGTQQTTPLYLAPEIAQGQSHSIQSDIYSLGVIIYQILSGDIGKPMSTGWQEDVQDGLLVADIIGATHGSVGERTPSAATLRDNLDNINQRRAEFESSKVLEARANEAEMALKRSQARRPWVYTTGAALSIGLCASLFFGFDANKARKSAELNAQKATATSEFLKDVLISADPRTPGVGPDATVSSSLKRAQALAEERYGEAVGTQIEIKETIATVYSGLDDPEEISIWENISEQVNSHYGENSDEYRKAQYRLAHALIRQGEYDKAEEIIESLESWEKSDDPDIVKIALQAKGRLKLVQLKYDESIPFNEELNAILSAEPAPDLDVLHTVRIDLAQSYSRIEGQEAKAVHVLRQLLEEPFINGGVDAWRITIAKSLLGAALIYVFEYEEAEPLIKEALQETKDIYGEDSVKVLDVLGYLGQLYAGTERRLESARIFGEMREFACKKYGNDNIRCTAYMVNEGINYIDVGDYELAANKLQSARPAIQKVLGANSPFDQSSSFHLATALLELGQTEEAGQLIQNLEIDKLTAGSPGARWDLLLGALKTRYEIRTNYSDDANKRLKSILDELIAIEAEATLIARTSSDIRP